jgi:hypothetical protein
VHDGSDARDYGPTFSYSVSVESVAHEIHETPQEAAAKPNETIPIDAFRHASTMQALVRYLVDIRGLRLVQASQLIGRSPKSAWASYHQTDRLPAVDEATLRIPISIFRGVRPPLEALVAYLRGIGLRNAEIARALQLDPRTTWTAAKRAEVRR